MRARLSPSLHGFQHTLVLRPLSGLFSFVYKHAIIPRLHGCGCMLVKEEEGVEGQAVGEERVGCGPLKDVGKKKQTR